MIDRAPHVRFCGLSLLAALVLANCGGDPHWIRLTSESPDVQLARLRNRRGLSAEETRLLYEFFARVRMESPDRMPPGLAGRTVGEVIVRQRGSEMAGMEAIATGERQVPEWRLEADPVLKQMDAALWVRVLGIEDPPDAIPGGDGPRPVMVRLEFENISRRTIIEAEGAVKFTDIGGRDLFSGTALIREPLRSRKIVERVCRVECAPVPDRELVMNHVRLADTRASWEPRRIRFENGGGLVASPEP